MTIQTINLGTAPSGIGGDTNRAAFTKTNENFAYLDLLEKVAGTAWASASGSVTLDLDDGRVFLREMTGNITELSFSNIPSGTTQSAYWTLALRVDSTGGYTLSSPPSVTWVDGSTWADVNLAADAVTVVQFRRVGDVTQAAIAWNGELALDPYKVCFLEDATIILLAGDESIDVASAAKFGDGTVTYSRNGSTITSRTSFSAGDRLRVICSGATETTTVSVPRYAL